MIHNDKWGLDISGKGKNITFTVYGEAVVETHREFMGYYGSQPAYMDEADTVEYDTEMSIEEYLGDAFCEEMDEIQAKHPEIKLWDNFGEENEKWANWEHLDEETCNKMLDLILEINPDISPWDINNEIVQKIYERNLPEPDYPDYDDYY